MCSPHHELRWLARYRQYCNRKMRRLRKALKFVHWEQGKGKSKFQQKTITTENATGSRPPTHKPNQPSAERLGKITSSFNPDAQG